MTTTRTTYAVRYVDGGTIRTYHSRSKAEALMRRMLFACEVVRITTDQTGRIIRQAVIA